jgi:shikimate 5-dehydrogenase
MNGEVRIVLSTLPAAAEFQLPSWFIESSRKSDSKPIIFDVNYKPFWTKLLDQANSSGFPLVRGSDMLWEQGVGQFELWTGRTAPYKVMKEVVLKNCMPEEN